MLAQVTPPPRGCTTSATNPRVYAHPFLLPSERAESEALREELQGAKRDAEARVRDLRKLGDDKVGGRSRGQGAGSGPRVFSPPGNASFATGGVPQRKLNELVMLVLATAKGALLNPNEFEDSKLNTTGTRSLLRHFDDKLTAPPPRPCP